MIYSFKYDSYRNRADTLYDRSVEFSQTKTNKQMIIPSLTISSTGFESSIVKSE